MPLNNSVFSQSNAMNRDVVSHEAMFIDKVSSFIERMDVQELEIKFKVFEDYLCYIGNHSNVFDVCYVTVSKLLKEYITEKMIDELRQEPEEKYMFDNLSNIYENHIMRMLKLFDSNIFNSVNLIYNRMINHSDIYIKWLYLNVIWFVLDRFNISLDITDVENEIDNKILNDYTFPFCFVKSKCAVKFLSSILSKFITMDVDEYYIHNIIYTYSFNFKILSELKSNFVLLDFFIKQKNKKFYIGNISFQEIVIMANKRDCISEIVSYIENVINEENFYNGKEYIIIVNKYGDKIKKFEKDKILKLYKICEKHKKDNIIISHRKEILISSGGIKMKFNSLIEMREWYVSEFIKKIYTAEVDETVLFTPITDDGKRYTRTGFETQFDFEINKLNIIIFESFMNNNNLINVFNEFFKDKNNIYQLFSKKFIEYFDIYYNYTLKKNNNFANEMLSEDLILLVEPALREFITETEESELIIPETSRNYIDRVSLLQQLYDMFEKYSCMNKTVFSYIKDRVVGTMGRDTNYKIEGLRNRYGHGFMFNSGGPDLVNIFVFVILILMDISESDINYKNQENNKN